MNIYLIIASLLTTFAFFLHTFIGDQELRLIEPLKEELGKKREAWTMIRCGWHWISFDLLFAAIGLSLITFTNYLSNESLLLQILSIYFFGYAIVWMIGIIISPPFPNRFIKLGQWGLLIILGSLTYLGS